MDKNDQILVAINQLLKAGRKPTAANIQPLTGLRFDQIYSSKHKDKLSIRGRAKKQKQAKPEEPKAIPAPSKTTNINLVYRFPRETLSITIEEAGIDEIEDSIENLQFPFKHTINHLEREKAKLL